MPIVRRIALNVIAVALLLAPCVADFSAQRSVEAACRTASCCIGMKAHCPMHRESAPGPMMRSCSSADFGAVAPTAAVLRNPVPPAAPAAYAALSNNRLHRIHGESPAPPTPPPQFS